jgi:colicin import membrane protein
MEALWVESSSNEGMEPRWSRVLILSFVFHMIIFSIILFAPESMPTRRISGAIYEVNLVEMPTTKQSPVRPGSEAKATQRLTVSERPSPAKRISMSENKEDLVVIGKKVIKTNRPRVTTSPSKLIDQAVAKIERKVKAEKRDHVGQAISRLRAQLERGGGEEAKGDSADKGIIIRIYQMEVEQRIKSNWSYPVAIVEPEIRKTLEAIVVVKVNSNGKILKSWVKKRSSNVMFDQSVVKAIDRSDPLPPFPEGYRRTQDEIEINFNLRDLEGY